MAAEGEPRVLTAEERRRNVERVQAIEARLGQAELKFAVLVYGGASALRELHEMRDELRDVFGMEKLAPLAPLYERMADDAVAVEKPATKTTKGKT